MKVSLNNESVCGRRVWRLFCVGRADVRPRPIYRTTDEVEARDMIARLNAAAIAGAASIEEANARPLYWCEIWESGWVIDCEKENDSDG